MQLSFLGQFYSSTGPIIEAQPTDETAVFMGRPYLRKQYRVAQHQSTDRHFIYRGISYTR